MTKTRLDDVNEDLNLSMEELRGELTIQEGATTRSIVRVLGSIAVTLAMMYDHMKQGGK